MSIAPWGKLSRRMRKVWLSVGASTLGVCGLLAVILWVESGRNTDLQDPSAQVTAFSKSSVVADAPPIRFRDVARDMGLVMRHGPGRGRRKQPEDTRARVAWGDYEVERDLE